MLIAKASMGSSLVEKDILKTFNCEPYQFNGPLMAETLLAAERVAEGIHTHAAVNNGGMIDRGRARCDGRNAHGLRGGIRVLGLSGQRRQSNGQSQGGKNFESA
jgi:hypothetical protein